MKIYYVDFSGYCEIEANTIQEAEEKFWEFLSNDKPLPSNIYEIEGFEEKRTEK